MTNTYRPAKLFTVAEANATLPLVKAIVRDIVALSSSIIDRRSRLDYLKSRQRSNRPDVPAYADELADAERQLARDIQQLQEYVAELEELGVELKSASEGLVDFPSMMDGRIVYLCWKHGEPEIQYWHELDAGFAGRQPLAAESTVSPGT
ncbi:MAG: hypothetical protein KatS3mg109_1519 [Pirellulaceae bacterium]|nr:MAG: hypothetical protein KatS3mg109_1519 [Pirellulaceae bacterium]